jgi:hypothetical protein
MNHARRLHVSEKTLQTVTLPPHLCQIVPVHQQLPQIALLLARYS